MISDMVDKKRTHQDGRQPVALMIVGYQGNKHLLSIFLSEIKERVVVVSSNNRLHGKVLYLNSTDLICPFKSTTTLEITVEGRETGFSRFKPHVHSNI